MPPLQLAHDRVLRGLLSDPLLCTHVPAGHGHRGSLIGEVGGDLDLAQAATIGQGDLCGGPATTPRLGEECIALDPNLGVDGARTLAQEGKVALVDLGQGAVIGSIQVDLGPQTMLPRDLFEHIRIVDILEGARAASHPQVLAAVLR